MNDHNQWFALLNFIYWVSAAFVIIGVLLEGAEIFHSWTSKGEPAKEPTTLRKKILLTESIGFVILIFGLVGETSSHFLLEAHHHQEKIESDEKLAQAMTQASAANAVAAQANEKAAEANVKSKELESANLSLRSNLFTLEQSREMLTLSREMRFSKIGKHLKGKKGTHIEILYDESSGECYATSFMLYAHLFEFGWEDATWNPAKDDIFELYLQEGKGPEHAKTMTSRANAGPAGASRRGITIIATASNIQASVKKGEQSPLRVLLNAFEKINVSYELRTWNEWDIPVLPLPDGHIRIVIMPGQ